MRLLRVKVSKSNSVAALVKTKMLEKKLENSVKLMKIMPEKFRKNFNIVNGDENPLIGG